jgi:sporulation protein YlmC with PRC-barrel domain
MAIVDTTETSTTARIERKLLAPRVLGSTRVVGNRVRNPAGEDLGTIDEVMLDIAAGRIAYVVLSYGSVLGVGGRYFAIPWEMLVMRPGEEVWILDVAKDALDRAPGIPKEMLLTGDVEWTVEDVTRVVKPRAGFVEQPSGRIIGLDETDRRADEREVEKAGRTTTFVPPRR